MQYVPIYAHNAQNNLCCLKGIMWIVFCVQLCLLLQLQEK